MEYIYGQTGLKRSIDYKDSGIKDFYCKEVWKSAKKFPNRGVAREDHINHKRKWRQARWVEWEILLGSPHSYTYHGQQTVTLLILESCSIILGPWFSSIDGRFANKVATVIWTNGPQGSVSTRDPDLAPWDPRDLDL